MTAWFAPRWRGEVPMQTLLWRDMLLTGSAINLSLTGLGLGILAAGGGIGWAVGLHFAPFPLNLFLCLCVWRSPQRTALALGVAVLWFGAMLVV